MKKLKYIQRLIHDPDWKKIYEIEDKIIEILLKVYNGNIVVRNEIDEIVTIRLQFKIYKDNYELLLSKRDKNFGFSIYNINSIDKMHEYNTIASNITIKNDKFYLYNIYKIIFRVIKI